MPLDDATTAFLGQMLEAGMKPIHESTPEEVRALGPMLLEMYGEGPSMARVEDVSVPSDEGDIPVRLLVPEGQPKAVLVYYHGGGWVIGALDEFETLGRRLAARSGCVVALVDYRLAPEHRYPAAVEDAYAALEWVAANVEDIAGADVPLIVAGDSAGGNLAAVVAIWARDRNGPEIAFQVLVYPVTDADVDNGSYTDPENQLFLSRDGMIWFWDHYAPDVARRNEAGASPLREVNLTDLPPAVVLTAKYDPLSDEGAAYAKRLEEAGVPVDYHHHDDQMHGFFTLLMLPGSEKGLEQVASALDARLAVEPV